MKARNKSVTRDLLRVFEIALFFAISVLGYGMLAKTSGTGSKSKGRSQLSVTRNTFIPESFERALRECRILEAASAQTHLTERHQHQTDLISSFTVPIHFERPERHLLPADHDSGQVHGIASNSPHLPFNLLQQNPVLLV